MLLTLMSRNKLCRELCVFPCKVAAAMCNCWVLTVQVLGAADVVILLFFVAIVLEWLDAAWVICNVIALDSENFLPDSKCFFWSDPVLTANQVWRSNVVMAASRFWCQCGCMRKSLLQLKIVNRIGVAAPSVAQWFEKSSCRKLGL